MCLPKFLGGMFFWRENLGKWGEVGYLCGD